MCPITLRLLTKRLKHNQRTKRPDGVASAFPLLEYFAIHEAMHTEVYIPENHSWKLFFKHHQLYRFHPRFQNISKDRNKKTFSCSCFRSCNNQASIGKWAPECDFYHVNDNCHLPSVHRHVCLMTYGYLMQKPSLWGLTVRSPDWCTSAQKHMLLITGKTHRVTLCPMPFDLQIYTQPVKQMARCFMQTWCFLTHWPFVKFSWKFLLLSKVHRSWFFCCFQVCVLLLQPPDMLPFLFSVLDTKMFKIVNIFLARFGAAASLR